MKSFESIDGGEEKMTLAWFLACAAVGYFADRKGRNPWIWGLASVFLSPFLVGLVLALMPAVSAAARAGSSAGAGVGAADDRSRLPEAGFDETGQGREMWDGDLADEDGDGEYSVETRHCPECWYVLNGDEEYCPRCGEKIF